MGAAAKVVRVFADKPARSQLPCLLVACTTSRKSFGGGTTEGTFEPPMQSQQQQLRFWIWERYHDRVDELGLTE
jgi:hypothetical protein